MTDWFTSDTHFNHRNIIVYCGRPFTKGDGQPDLDLMNDTFVSRWNERVQPDDIVRHVGDLFLGPWALARPIIARLNGHIILVKGNHDQCTNTVYRSMGIEPCKSANLYIDGRRILLKHNPRLMDLTDYDLGLCGHVHEAWVERQQAGKRVINVGVDVRGFRPVSLPELLGDLWNL